MGFQNCQLSKTRVPGLDSLQRHMEFPLVAEIEEGNHGIAGLERQVADDKLNAAVEVFGDTFSTALDLNHRESIQFTNSISLLHIRHNLLAPSIGGVLNPSCCRS